MSSDGSVEEFSVTKEDRAKTVTFSEPEDQDLSDNSSICQSPSWEQYGQKKKKKPKKRSTQKISNDKEGAALKKKSNRLVKTAPTDPFTSKRLATSDRSLSAPELDSSTCSKPESIHPLAVNPQFVMTKQHEPGNGLGHEANPKPRSKGFLSGFRLQHGNVAAVQKILESRKGVGENDANEPLRSIQYETIPAHQPNAPPPSTQKPRKPPSIMSTISTSDHSLSSQEKRSSGARASTGSGHGRSQSLLSSTLNKLRGPSYLYYRPSEEGSNNDVTKQSDGPQDIGPIHQNHAEVSGDQTKKAPSENNKVNFEHAQHPFDFSFPPKPRRTNTEPGPDIAPRGRQPRSRRMDSQPPNIEHIAPVQRTPGSRRVQIEIPQASTRDTVMAMVAAQERQSQTVRTAQQTRSNPGSFYPLQDSAPESQGKRAEPEHRRSVARNQKGEVQRPRYTQAGPGTVLEERLPEKEAKAPSNRNERHTPEDDQISVGTYASTIRPVSQNHEGALAERRLQTFSQPEGLISDLPPMAPERRGIMLQAFAEGSVDDLISFEREPVDTLQQPLQPQRDFDYFASFSDSYTLPVIDLRSPSESKLPSSRLFKEGGENRGGSPIVRPTNGDAEETPTMDGGVHEAARAIDSNGKEFGRLPKEQKTKDSPTISTQYSDSDVPAFERLGLSAKAAKVLAGTDTASTSTAHSQHTDPSRTTSERSSSSTCDDAPPSPSSATTPDSSRPQSRKGVFTSQPEPSQATALESAPQEENITPRKPFDGQPNERTDEKTVFYSTTFNSDVVGGGLEKLPTFPRAEGLTIGQALVATPTSVSFADVVKQDVDEVSEQEVGQHSVPPLPARAQSALDLHSIMRPSQQSSRPPRLQMKSGEVASSISLPNSPPPELADGVMPRKSALKMSRNNSSNGVESTAMSVGGAYLQEARKTAPVPTTSSSRTLRPSYSQKSSSTSIKSAISQSRAEPLAKMLVECCNCHFFHDMPSRVYECMAKPDSVVEDKSLGVSAAITTMVRCPWCAHGMTTQCCSGYAAVVYLKEKLHGK